MAASNDLKEILVTYLHATRINTYTEVYQKNNGGKSPSKKQINDFVAIMVAQGSLEKDAGELHKELVGEIRKDTKIKHILTNASFSIPICMMLGLMISFLWAGQIPDDFKKPSYRYPAMIAAAFFIIVITVGLVLTATKKDK